MRRSSSLAWFSIVSVLIGAAACNTPAVGPRDMGAGGDAGVGGDAGPRVITLPAATTGPQGSPGVPVVASCVGMAMAPAPGAAVSFTLNLLSFGTSGDHAPNTKVCFCGNNTFAAEALSVMPGTSCGTGCQLVTTDASGHATVMGRANGWYAYRVFASNPPGPTFGTTFLDSIQVNEPTPSMAGATSDANAISSLIAMTVAEAELIPRLAGTTTFAGRVRDCHGDNVQGAIVRAYHADGTEILDGGLMVSLPHYRFFSGDGMTPASDVTNTQADGLFVVLNVPPASHGELVRLEAWAFTGTGATGTATRIGCEAAQAFPDGLSIVNLGPTRSDYPAGHPCHP